MTFMRQFTLVLHLQIPNNEFAFSLSGDNKVMEYFQIEGSTGQISLMRNLHDDPDKSLVYSVSYD